MDYDFRNRAYDGMYGDPPPSSNRPMYGQPMYPRVAVGGNQSGHAVIPPVVGRQFSNNQSSSQSSSSSSSSGWGIRVALKPEYRITPPPQLSPQIGEIPRSNFHFDFEFEKKLLAESEKDAQYWTKLGLENLPSGSARPSSSSGPAADPVVAKYIASGLNREAVPLAIAQYGDNPAKVQEFATGFALLREMGFSSNKVAEALIMYDNDTDRAIAYFLGGGSA
ncbi:hypothetical protein ACFE04_009397 [Oxalis oulophora]